jgi:energy-coupling factor transport system ATP-binding protein
MIELEHISYWYPRCKEAALRDVTLRFDDGEAVCVMGRNGSGKSTLVKLIAGLIEPGRGSIAVGQQAAGSASSGGVAILFQNPDNQMVATVVEKEIAFALENRAMLQSDMETIISSTAAQFGIEHLRRRLTSELSGGEKQRVALASVMVQEPSVLLLDEPDSFLDQTGRRILADELRSLHEHDRALIEFRITQSADVACDYARLIVLDDGAVVADGPPDEVLADRALSGRTGLIVPDAAIFNVAVPDRLNRLMVDEQRLRQVSIEQVDFAWPLSATVLRDMNLSLARGETIGLVGPTGVGKSSLALLIAGLVSPDRGQVVYLNGVGSTLTPGKVHGQVSLVLQQPERQFFLENCAREIEFGPTNLGQIISSTEIDGFLHMVGLNPVRYRDRDPFTLSAGEKRRLAFAAVLSMAPSIIVFDEPTAGLDGEGMGRFIALSLALKSLGTGQMIISHDGDVIRRLTDYVIYLAGPGQARSLEPSELFDNAQYAGVVTRPGSLF